MIISATRKAFHACGFAIVAALFGCAEGTLTPKDARVHLAFGIRVERASTSATATPLDINVTVSYARNNALGNVVLGSGTASVQSGTGSAAVPVDVNLGACISDPNRASTGDACGIVISAVLRRGGAALDSVAIGPVNATPGDTVAINSPLVLHELARLRLSWAGSVQGATGDTLRAGRTLTLVAAAEDAAGTSLPDRSATWSSNAPSIVTVGAQTGIVTPLAPGVAVITASSAGRTATFDARVYAAAQNLQFIGGDDQSVTLSNFGSTIAVKPIVRVTDAQGRPAAQVTTTFAVIAGGGQLAGQAALRTDSLGLVSTGAWTLAGTGLNTLSATVVAVAPATLNAYVPLDGQLAPGINHTCSLAANGSAGCWGLRNFGVLGDNINSTAVAGRVTPTGNPTFTSIISHGFTTCGVTPTGSTLCWGRNVANDGSANTMRLVPTVLGGQPFKMAAPGRLGGCYLALSGNAFCWGINQSGEVGNGNQLNQLAATQVLAAPLFERIESSWQTNCGLTAAGATWCWGRMYGENTTVGLAPALIPGGHQFVSIHGGSSHHCGLTANGEAWCWGLNGFGQLGDSTTTASSLPVRATKMHFVRMAASTVANQNTGKTCGLTVTGVAYCWGTNQTGELGNGQFTGLELAPQRLLINDAVAAVGFGDFHGCAMTFDRRVFCWGDNLSGQLGNGTTSPGEARVPTIVP